MLISYRTSIRLATAIVLAVVASGIVVSYLNGNREISLGGTAASIASKVMSVTGTTLVLTDFERKGMRGSKTAWELKAKRGELDPDTNDLNLSDAHLRFQDENGMSTNIDAETIKAMVRGTTIDSAHLIGNVRVKRTDLEMETDEAVYDKTAGLVRSPNSVTIRNGSVITTGTQLDADLNRRHFVLHSHVTTLIQPGGLNKPAVAKTAVTTPKKSIAKGAAKNTAAKPAPATRNTVPKKSGSTSGSSSGKKTGKVQPAGKPVGKSAAKPLSKSGKKSATPSSTSLPAGKKRY